MSHPFASITNLTISDSSRKAAISCWRKFEFRKLYNSSRKDDSQAAGVGQALHIAVQQYMKDPANPDAAIMELLLNYPIQYDAGPMKPRSLEACYATLAVALSHPRLKEYELARIVVDGELRDCIEVPFRFNVAGFSLSANRHVPVAYEGMLDLILYDRFNDRYIVVDIKTTTTEIADATPMYKNEEQLIPYAIVLEHLLGKPIDSLDILYMQLYIDAVEPKCRWYPFTKTKEDVQDWLRGLLIDLRQAAMFFDMGWFPRRGNACNSWKRPCVFFDVCDSRDPKTIELMLSMNKPEEERKPLVPWVEIELQYTLED